ncbi:hypothetical protein [Flagellimonas marina]|uniref:Uncharacterized protein n=1 Tax=Flagellimonas marina TaxID=1775168 RepID=A0ABV8PG86_9FLAO
MDGNREAPRRSKTYCLAWAGKVFKEVETLFVGKTCLGLDRFNEGPRNSIRPIGKGVYGKLNDRRQWCPDWKSLGTALFFDVPKNNKGFFY